MASRHHIQFYRANTLRLSNHGLLFLVFEEGIRLHPYVDSEGWATAGIGHLIQPMHKGVTAHDRAHYTFRSNAEAFAFFRRYDEPVYEAAIHRALGRAWITRAQYDMCFSLCFNIGTGGFEGSTVARLIRQGDRRAAAKHFPDWDNPRVLLPRREREERRFVIAHW